MPEVDRLLAANAAHADAHVALPDGHPRRQLAVVTCMDARIDVLDGLGLAVGDAHVIRNAGGRVTEDVLRSLALSVHVLGVRTVVLVQHTRCGLEGVTDEELAEQTGAPLAFLPIADHDRSLAEDAEVLAGTSYLAPIEEIAGLVYDIGSGALREVVRLARD
jgi:carbonic anhydrase